MPRRSTAPRLGSQGADNVSAHDQLCAHACDARLRSPHGVAGAADHDAAQVTEAMRSRTRRLRTGSESTAARKDDVVSQRELGSTCCLLVRRPASSVRRSCRRNNGGSSLMAPLALLSMVMTRRVAPPGRGSHTARWWRLNARADSRHRRAGPAGTRSPSAFPRCACPRPSGRIEGDCPTWEGSRSAPQRRTGTPRPSKPR